MRRTHLVKEVAIGNVPFLIATSLTRCVLLMSGFRIQFPWGSLVDVERRLIVVHFRGLGWLVLRLFHRFLESRCFCADFSWHFGLRFFCVLFSFYIWRLCLFSRLSTSILFTQALPYTYLLGKLENLHKIRNKYILLTFFFFLYLTKWFRYKILKEQHKGSPEHDHSYFRDVSKSKEAIGKVPMIEKALHLWTAK